MDNLIVNCVSVQYLGVKVFDKSKMDKLSYLKVLCSNLNVALKIDIKKKTNKKEYTWGRMIYYHLAKKNTLHTLAKIGEIVSTDHSTVVHGVKKYNELYEFDSYFKKYADTIIEKVIVNNP